MPPDSVSEYLVQALHTRSSLLLLVMFYVLLSTTTTAQVNYAGSGAVDFGSQAIATASAPKTLTFSITSGTTVGSIGVLTTGTANLDFTEATGTTCTAMANSSSTNCQVNVTFKPRAAGLRMGAVVFFSGANNSGTVLASAFVHGVGTGPQISYGPGIATVIDPTVNGGTLDNPWGVAVNAAGDLFIAGYGGVVKVPAGGGGAIGINPTISVSGGPTGVAVDGAGNLFIPHAGGTVVAVPVGGGPSIAIDPTVDGLGLNFPTGVAIDGAGDLYIADEFNSRVVEIPAEGGPAMAINPTVSGLKLSYPTGVAVDGAGDLFIADLANNRVVEIPAGNGPVTVLDPTVNGAGLNHPFGVAVDGAGDLFITDQYNGRVVEVPAGGGAATAVDPAVNGTALYLVYGVAVDSAGDLFIADLNNNRVVEVQHAQPPALIFGTASVNSISSDSPQTVQIANDGNEALTITGLTYPTDFPEAIGYTNECTSSTSLSPGQECDLSIDFRPRSGTQLREVVTLTDNALNVNGAQQLIAVSGTGTATIGPPTHFSVVTRASVIVGSPFTMTVTALDANGNTSTNYDGSVVFTSSDPLFVNPGPLTLAQGVGQTTVNLRTVGTQTITATATTNSALSGTGSFLASPGAAAAFVIQVPRTATAGAAFSFTVTVVDVYGNPVPSYGGTVSFSSTDPNATLPNASTLSGGESDFSATLMTGGEQTITATDSTNHVSSSSSPIAVSLISGPPPANFGSQAIGIPSVSTTLTFSFSSSTPAGSIQVVTQGATGLDFINAGTGTCAAGATYSAGASCTVDVIFKPTLSGPRYGAAKLLDASGNALATAYLKGTGVGPMANFLPGVVSTILSGLNGPSGIAADASGNLYITAGDRVLKETISGTTYTESMILSREPSQVGGGFIGVAVDGSGNVFVVDNSAFKVLKATPSANGYSISEIGSGLNYPLGVAVDGNGNVYIANAGFSQVMQEIPLPTGGYTQAVIIPSVSYDMWGIAVDGQDNLYLNTTNPDVRPGTGESIVLKETPSQGSYIETAIADLSSVNLVYGLAVDGSGNVYTALNGGVAKFTPTSNGYTQTNLAMTASPNAVAVDGSGNVYAFNGGSILKLDVADPPSLTFATTSVNLTSTDSPQTVVFENAGTSALTLTSVSYPIDFPQASGVSNACMNRSSLASGQGCNLAIDFTPRSVGIRSEDVTLIDNTLNKDGFRQNISVSGTGIGIVGAATHFRLTTTAPQVAGSPFTLTVTGLDYLGNIATLYSGSVAFTSSDPLFVNPGTLALSGGVGQTTVTLKTSGRQTIKVTDTTNPEFNGTGIFAVASAAAASLVVTVPLTAKIDRMFPLTVTAEDLYGNQATGYTGTISFSSTDPLATLPGTSRLINGKGNFSATFRKEGQQTIKVTDSGNQLSAISGPVIASRNAPNDWTWMGGSSTIGSDCTPNQLGLNCGRPGVYGTLGKADRGSVPGARSGAQSWTDRRGNLWLFGGTGFDGAGNYGLLNDLWKFVPSSGDWVWVGGSNTVPAEFAGLPGVYGDLGVPAPGNLPGSRSGASTWTDQGGNLWLFGGSGVDATGAAGYLNDLWEFKPSLNQWAWMGGSSTIGSNGGQSGMYGTLGTPAAENMPGGRSGASSWTDTRGHLWLFGGASFTANPFFYSTWYLNDLWEFFPDVNEWAWMGGSNSNNPATFVTSTCDPYSGCGWIGAYGSLGVPDAGNNPGSRSGASGWVDRRGRLWLYGGYGFDATQNSSGLLNDLWEFDPANQEWTWKGGSSTVPFELGGQPGVYGTLGSPSAANSPGGRTGASSWTDSIGYFWLYGGAGVDANGSPGELNDLWIFNPSTDEWAWMSGSSTTICLPQNNGNCGRPGEYGVLGMPGAENVPGGRSDPSSWMDNGGNLWLFGGEGYDSQGNANRVPDNLNDFWKYELPDSCDDEMKNGHGCHDVRDRREQRQPESPHNND